MKFRLHNYIKPERLLEAKRSNWTVEEMKDVLARNDDQVGKALVKLYELQTEDEKASGSTHEYNSVGFNSFDAEILSSFAEFYMKYHRLSPKQLAIARKKIMKYAKQLVNIANSANAVNTNTATTPSVSCVLTIEADGTTYIDHLVSDVNTLKNKILEFLKTEGPKIKNLDSLDIAFIQYKDEDDADGEWLVYLEPKSSLNTKPIKERIQGKDKQFVTVVSNEIEKLLPRQIVLTLDMFEDLHLSESKNTSLSAEEINNIRNVIHHKLGIPTAGMRIWPDGRFEFTNISESEARRISYGLERFDLASNIYQSKGSIDFSHYTPLGQPKSKFNVRGELNLDELLEENLAKIDEAFEDDNTCYKAVVCWDEEDINDNTMWTDEYFTAKSEEAVIEYINNNYEPYKIINISKMNIDKLLDNEKYEMFDTCIHLDEDFVNYNANPQGRNEGDCTIRALSLAYNLSYANVKSDLISLGNKNKSKFNTFPTINAFMEKHRFKKYLNNEDGSINVSTVENFAKKYHHGNYVVRCSDRSKQDMSHAFHLVAVIDGKIYDTWDSADYFVIDAWEVAGNGKHILNTKGIKESTYFPTAGRYINSGGQSIKSVKAYSLGNIDNPEQNPISKPAKISKDSGKHEEKLLQFVQRIQGKKYSDFSKNRKKSPIDLYDRFTIILSAMDFYTISTKLPEYKLLHTPNIISYTDVSVDSTTGYIKARYQNDAELKASTALADFYDIPYTIKKDEIIFKILPDNESWD